MDYRVVSLPPFLAAASGPDPAMDFSPGGVLGRFDAWFSALSPAPRDAFLPRDFMYWDEERQAPVWVYALWDGLSPAEWDVVSFPGGLYLTYHYRDGDEEAGARAHREALEHLRASGAFLLDESPARPVMGHIITPKEAIRAQGWALMEQYVPVRVREPACQSGD